MWESQNDETPEWNDETPWRNDKTAKWHTDVVSNESKLVKQRVQEASRQIELYGKPLLPKAIQILNLGATSFSTGKLQILNRELKRRTDEFSKEMVELFWEASVLTSKFFISTNKLDVNGWNMVTVIR